jgi:nicotinamidase-related amidase
VSRTGLLIMDVQRAIVERLGGEAPAFLDRLGATAAAARSAGVPVVYVRVGFRPGAPEISPRNRAFAAVAPDAFGEASPGTRIPAIVAPGPEDIVVTKRRVSAFAGSDLDVVLRSQGIDSLVLTGIATSGVVLSTLRQAADLDFGLTVLGDLCADGDPEVHRVLMDKVFPRQAEVMTAGQWIDRSA